MNNKIYKYYQKQGERRRLRTPSEYKKYMQQRLVAMSLTQHVLTILSHDLDNCRLLDIGCGEGWYLYNVVDRCDSAIGIDISWGHLKQAKLLIGDDKRLSLVQSDAINLPFRDGAFDLVLATDVLEHLVQPQEALREIKRVLRKEGKVLICVPSVLNPTEWIGRLINIIQGHFQDHLYFYTPRTAKKAIESAGFEVVKIATCCFLPPIFGGAEFRASPFRKMYDFLEHKLPYVPKLNGLGASIILLVRQRE